MQRGGQISSEYLIVIGFVVFLVLGLLSVAFFYTSNTSDRIRVSQASQFAQKIISSSEQVFYAGEPSKVTFTAYLPVGVKQLTISQYDVIFSISTSSGVSKLSFTSHVPLTGVLSSTEGVKRIAVTAGQNDVSISEV